MRHVRVGRIATVSASLLAICVASCSPDVAVEARVATWQLVEQWRIGGAEDGPLSLNEVKAIQTLSDGRVAVLEASDQQVHVFDANGKPLFSMGRKGSGPGEFRNATGFVVTPTGEFIVNDYGNRRLTVFDPKGTLIKSSQRVASTHSRYWDAYVDSTGHLIEFHDDMRRTYRNELGSIDSITQPACANIRTEVSSTQYFKFKIKPTDDGYIGMAYPFVIADRGASNTTDGHRWIGEAPDYRNVHRVAFGSCDLLATATLPGANIDVPEDVYNALRS